MLSVWLTMTMITLEITILILNREPLFWHLGLALTNLCLAIYVCYTARSQSMFATQPCSYLFAALPKICGGLMVKQSWLFSGRCASKLKLKRCAFQMFGQKWFKFVFRFTWSSSCLCAHQGPIFVNWWFYDNYKSLTSSISVVFSQ